MTSKGHRYRASAPVLSTNPFDDDDHDNNRNNAPSSSAPHPPRASKASTNPFDNEGLARPSAVTAQRRATTGPRPPSSSSSNNDGPLDPFESNKPKTLLAGRNTNAFEFDGEFPNSRGVKSEETPILTGMDEHFDEATDGFAPTTTTTTKGATAAAAEALRRANPAALAGWLRGSGQQQHKPVAAEDAFSMDASSPTMAHLAQETTTTPQATARNNTTGPSSTRKPNRKGNAASIARWPFDSYHQIQQMYYETVDQRTTATSPEQDATSPSSSSLIVTRPPELPDIATAVQGLSLADFEQHAQERAIGIIGTWIYDEALMDELWVVDSSTGGDILDPTTTTEGIELSASGYPASSSAAESAIKMNHEILKLRASTSRELDWINARLNDGVAASGSEVQELVQAVTQTKGDLGKLKELTQYLIAMDGATDQDASNGHHVMALLANYPKCRATVHARRNLQKCFRELDFFAQIPLTCDQLRDEMHSSEWQDHEWSTLRDVCRKHVELEVFLVEAEHGMKARIDAEMDQSYRHANPGRNVIRKSLSPRFGTSSNVGGGGQTYDSVDAFLEEHAANVWELGDEIKLRVLSGVGTTFDLALNNPAGMVALVEAIELYEAKANEYKAIHGDGTEARQQRLHFTEMRRSALEKICEDFEDRGLRVFKEVQQVAADEAGEDAATAAYNAVLRASNQLTNEMDFVKHHMSPCFPPSWFIEALWTSVVARVSSQNLFQQIGGRDGHRLHTLTVTQLLDLVAWIETFVEKTQETFPDIEIVQTSNNVRPHSVYDSGASLLHEDKKEIDVERAKDSVAWVSGALLEVKQLGQTEFIARTQQQTEEWLENVYNADHAKTQTEEGRLITSLCEDVFSLAGVQLRTIRERLTKKSDVLVLAVNIIFNSLVLQQRLQRDKFLMDLETCCAAANDFIRMSDAVEDILSELRDATNLSEQSIDDLYAQSSSLLQLYSTDAVFAAQRVHVYVFEPIEEEVGASLFDDLWESSLTHNELALTVVRTLEDYMSDLEVWLEGLMVRKVVDALVISTINFYIRRLLLKAEKRKDSSFLDPAKAYQRMQGDLRVFREYFDSLVGTFPALQRVIEQEFKVMDLVMTLLGTAAGLTDTEPAELVWEFQKRIKDAQLTKAVVGNLFHLMNPKEENQIYEIIDDPETQKTLKDLAPVGQDPVDDRTTDRGLRLDLVVKDTLGASLRTRKGRARAQIEKMAQNLNQKWNEKSEKEKEGVPSEV